MRKYIILLAGFLLILLACGVGQDAADANSTPDESAETENPAEDGSSDEQFDPVETPDEDYGYQTRGLSASGESFSGAITIETTDLENTYLIDWCEGPEVVQQGVGMDFGDGLVAIGSEGPVVEICRKTDVGFTGFFFNGADELGVEIISEGYSDQPLPEPSDIAVLQPWPGSPVFEVSGTNPDGSDYTGVLHTQPMGAGGAMILVGDDGDQRRGGGVMLDDGTIVAAFSPIGVIVYEQIDEDVWRGEWYSPNIDALGVEWITTL